MRAREAEWVRLLSAGFGFADEPFAADPVTLEHALAYQREIKRTGHEWDDILRHFKDYADQRGWNASKRHEELKRVAATFGYGSWMVPDRSHEIASRERYFAADGDAFLYYHNSLAPGIRVSAEEKQAYLDIEGSSERRAWAAPILQREPASPPRPPLPPSVLFLRLRAMMRVLLLTAVILLGLTMILVSTAPSLAGGWQIFWLVAGLALIAGTIVRIIARRRRRIPTL
ncbi:MAG: hypothetical protein IBJ13_06345 [Sphingopyxis sp.]|nr:hypothetical protein [Sphingopyxis sp.]